MKGFERELYYGTGKYQPLDFWESLHMPASLATMLKYLVRAGKKDGESKYKDLHKAENYWNTFLHNINEHVMFSFSNTFSSSEFYSHNLQQYNITRYESYLEDDGYSDSTVKCITSILFLSLKLVANNSKADTYTQYLNEIMLIDIPSISQSFNEVLKEEGVD